MEKQKETLYNFINFKNYPIPDGFEEPELYSPEYFGDNDEHKMELFVFDGIAVENCVKDNPTIVVYPTVAEVKADKKLLKEVKDCIGNGAVTAKNIQPYDILLTMGKVTDCVSYFGKIRNLPLNTMDIEFDGNTYPAVCISHCCGLECICISSESLDYELDKHIHGDDDCLYEEAYDIDSQIFGYAPDEAFELPWTLEQFHKFAESLL